jgi:signal transduction histidine kinase
MKNPVRILLLEDSPADAVLVRHALRQGGLNFVMHHVDTKPAFVRQLNRPAYDLILSDFALPSFDGFTALALAREKCPDLPFIFVTGTLGEEVAIDTLKKGATDYVLKHRLSRLVPSVQRALREAGERAERKRAEARLRESHEQLRALSVYLQYVREEERIRIAREVHDELGQALTGLKLQLIWLISRLPKTLKLFHEKARSMSQHIDAIIQAVRRIATELRPGVLDTAGLLAALEWQAHEFQTQTGIQCRVNALVPDALWDQDLNTAFFRIFQETLTNIIRHARATRVNVRLFEEGGELVLEVKDNGSGISEGQIQSTKSIGLLGMRERAALLGGRVEWRGQPGKGTTMTARIPRPESGTGATKNRHENSTYRRPRAGSPGIETDSRG